MVLESGFSFLDYIISNYGLTLPSYSDFVECEVRTSLVLFLQRKYRLNVFKIDNVISRQIVYLVKSMEEIDR